MFKENSQTEKSQQNATNESVQCQRRLQYALTLDEKDQAKREESIA